MPGGNETWGPSTQGSTNPSAAGVTPDQKNSRNLKGVMSDSQKRKPKMHSAKAAGSRKKSGLGKRKSY